MGRPAGDGDKSAGPYATSLDHVLAELARLDLLLSVEVQRARGQHSADDERGLAGLYIPEADVDALLTTPIGTPSWSPVALPPELLEPVQARLDETAAELAERTVESVREGVYLRLVVLAQLFGLAAFDVDTVLICLAPEIDRRYERLYAYLHDDVSRRQPTVELVLDLLCPDLAAKVAARTRFTPAAPLLRHRLVQLAEGAGPPSHSLLGQALQLDPRVARFLLDDDEVDERLQPLASIVTPATTVDDLVFPAEFDEQVARLVEAARTDGDRLVLYVQGPYGVGKQSLAEACCDAIGAELLVVSGRRLAEHDRDTSGALAHLVDREARLQGAMLYLDDFDALLAVDKQAHLATLLRLLDMHPGPTFLAGNTTWEPKDTLRGASFMRLEIPEPGYDQRLALWRTALADDLDADTDADLAAVANTFRLTGGQIGDAAATARNLARARAAPPARVTQDDLQAACRLQSNRKLAELALKVTPRHTWDDLVLPADHLEQLRELYNHVQYRAVVHDTWGFGQKVAAGRGLNVLFAGPPGTGKTMAADVLASALGLDLYAIDLSNVLSKYIGETEKNLARIFDEARSSNAVLFFDEADALFGKRTQVRDAHDRYANVEVSYLLQRMEEHEGLVVLATNLRKNMDEAFVRRLHVTIEFPLPGLADRRRIWEQIWPPPAPIDPALDLELLAREVEVSGGAIRNIALAGAFLAAADGGVVTMQHLLHATQREYEKMGKVLTSSPLGSPS